jgi:hypothetical protein
MSWETGTGSLLNTLIPLWTNNIVYIWQLRTVLDKLRDSYNEYESQTLSLQLVRKEPPILEWHFGTNCVIYAALKESRLIKTVLRLWIFSWLRHYATSQKVAGSIAAVVIGFLNWPNRSSRSMALGLTQPVIEMSTRNLQRTVGWGIRLTTSPQSLSHLSRKCGSPEVSQCCDPPWLVTRIALPLPLRNYEQTILMGLSVNLMYAYVYICM